MHLVLAQKKELYHSHEKQKSSYDWLDAKLADNDFASMHLQWFGAEDEGRTEEPSERQLKKARDEGKVVKSQEISGTILLISMMVTLLVLSQFTLKTIIEMLRFFYDGILNPNIGFNNAMTAEIFTFLAKLLLPIFSVSVVVSYLINFIQVGPLWSLKAIEPKFSKIAPNVTKWIQKSFLSPEAGFNLFKTLMKISVISFVGYLNMKNSIDYLYNPEFLTISKAMNHIGMTTFKIVIESAIVMLVFAVPDYFFQRWQHLDSLKMTKHDLKKEFKEQEGDPQVKNRLRQRMQQLLDSKIGTEVPKADVIITNPTHYAVALSWESVSMNAPVVLAKGEDNTALRIRRIANENDVPIVENRPLARALYASVEVGDTIPEEYWDVVSKILIEIYRLSGKYADLA